MKKEKANSTIQEIMKIAGIILASKGYLNSETADAVTSGVAELMTGITMWGLGQFWGLKKKSVK